MFNLFINQDAFDGMSEAEQKLYTKLTAEEAKELPAGIVFRFSGVTFNSPGWAIENVANLKNTLSKVRDEAKTAADSLKLFEGLEADKARKAIEQVADMANKDWTKDDKVKAQLAAREEALVAKHNTERTKLTEDNGKLTKQLHTHLVDNRAIAAIQKHKGNVELLLPHVRTKSRVEADSAGEFVSRVIAPDGTVRVTMKTGSTDPMDHDELVAEMKTQEVFMPAFEGTGQSGMGAGGSDRAGRSVAAGGSGKIVLSWEDQKDPKKYQAAKEAAEKANAEFVLEQPQPLQPNFSVSSGSG